MNTKTVDKVDFFFTVFFAMIIGGSVVFLTMLCCKFSNEISANFKNAFQETKGFFLRVDGAVDAIFEDSSETASLCGASEDDRVVYSVRTGDTTILSERELQLYAVAKKFAEENSGKTNFEIAMAANDYVCKNTEYAYNLLDYNQPYDDSQTSFGCLILGRTVCAGYTNGLNLLCNSASETIDATYVRGNVLDDDMGSHAWSMVRLDDGNYYHLDSTWNDTDDTDGWNYEYFLKSDSFFSETRTWERWMYHECPASVVL